MDGKLKLYISLVAVILMQLVEGSHAKVKECYSCDTPKSCRSAKVQICNQESANKTRNHLKLFFSNVPNVTNTQFECLKASYKYENSTVMSISGCINSGVNPCDLKSSGAAWISESCENCATNLCNLPEHFSSGSAIKISFMCLSFIIVKMLAI